MNKRLIVFTALLAVGTAHVAGAAMISHRQGIELRTYADSDGDGLGDAISANLTATTINGGALVMGPAMSPRESCNECHSYDSITSAYHFQLGADEMMDTNGDGFKDEVGDVLTAEGGPLASLPSIKNITSPGQFGGW